MQCDFAKHLSDNGIPMWIRHVLVPGITDSEEHLKSLKEFISTLKTVEKVEVLGYHTLGAHKWEASEEEYPLKGVPQLTKEEKEEAENIIRKAWGKEPLAKNEENNSTKDKTEGIVCRTC